MHQPSVVMSFKGTVSTIFCNINPAASFLRLHHFKLLHPVLNRSWRKAWWLWRSGHVCAVPVQPLGCPVWPLAPACLPPTAVGSASCPGSQEGRRSAPVTDPKETASCWRWCFTKVSRWKLEMETTEHITGVKKDGITETMNFILFFLRTWSWVSKWIPGELCSFPSCSWSGSRTCSQDWQKTQVTF